MIVKGIDERNAGSNPVMAGQEVFLSCQRRASKTAYNVFTSINHWYRGILDQSWIDGVNHPLLNEQTRRRFDR